VAPMGGTLTSPVGLRGRERNRPDASGIGRTGQVATSREWTSSAAVKPTRVVLTRPPASGRGFGDGPYSPGSNACRRGIRRTAPDGVNALR
jgi:hypothetical protein